MEVAFWLGLLFFVVADDLYKAADRLSYWNSALQTYLWASANPFFEAVRTRG
jgi:hypothetical protein